MAEKVKVSVLEVDGVELDFATEKPLEAEIVDLDNSANNYDATDVRGALEEIDFREIVKEPTGIVDRSQSTLSFNETTRLFTYTPIGAEAVHYIRGKRHSITSPATVNISNDPGIHFVYFNTDDQLISSLTPWDFEAPIAFVAIIFYDATNQRGRIGEERHGCVMDWATHKRNHRLFGTLKEPGGLEVINLTFGDGSLDSHAKFGVTNGAIHDEDIIMDITHSDTPASPFEQILTPYVRADIFYRNGTASPSWHLLPATEFPVITDGANTPMYNPLVGSTHVLQNVPEGYYFAMCIFASNFHGGPIIAIPGCYASDNIITTIEQNDINSAADYGFPTQEFHKIGKIIYQASTSYANAANCRIVSTVGIVPVDTPDRYVKDAGYTGNLGINKYLEWFSGKGSNEAPLPIHANSFIRTITVLTTAINTGTIGIYNGSAIPANLLYTIALNNAVESTVEVSVAVDAGMKLTLKVDSGSFNNPSLLFSFQTRGEL